MVQPLPVCKNQRIYKHKTFKHFAERGKSSIEYNFMVLSFILL